MFWYEFRKRNGKNMAKKCFGKYSSEQQNGVSNERSNYYSDVTQLLRQSAKSSDNSYIYSYSFKIRGIPAEKKEKVVPLSVSHTCVAQVLKFSTTLLGTH